MTTRTRRTLGPWLARNSWVGPLVALAVLYGVFSMLAPDSFPTAGNLRTMIRQTAVVGIAGLMQFSRLTVGDPTVAGGLELDIIAAVVIGGGTHLGLANWVQEIITGVIIIVAVAPDRLRHRKGLGTRG